MVGSWVRHVMAGDAIYRMGERGDAMFVVGTGHVAARLTSPAGDAVDVGAATEHEVFGYFEVIDDGRRSCDAIALQDSTVVVVPARIAASTFREHPDVLLALAGDLVRIIRLQNEDLANRLFRPVDVRLASLLLELARTGDHVDFGPQSVVAVRLGVARQTVNKALHGLAARGLVALHPGGRAVTIDRPRLRAYLTAPEG